MSMREAMAAARVTPGPARQAGPTSLSSIINMKRLAIVSLVVTAGLTAGQDMPLHEILEPGEEWKPYDGAMPARLGKYGVSAENRLIYYKGVPIPHPSKQPTCCAVALGGSTLLVAEAADRYVWAFQIQGGGTLGPGDRYCRLRVKGDDRRKNSTPAEAFRADPSAMTVDAANRTYVATKD